MEIPGIEGLQFGLWNAWIFTVCLALRRPLLRFINRKLWEKMVAPVAAERNRTHRTVRFLATLARWSIVAYSVLLPLKLRTVWFYVGLPVTVAGVIVYSIAWVNFATTTLQEPVTKGLYRYCRHPLEVTPLLTLLGLSIATSSWFLLLLSAALALLSRFIVIWDERFWLEKYGDAYREYMTRTPRWLPLPPHVRYQ